MCRQRIVQVAEKVGIAPQDIALVAVSKGIEAPIICEAVDAGVDQIAESRVQEAFLKYPSVQAHADRLGCVLRWHMIGHLQTNKVKQAVQIFDLIQSVDSVRLADAIDRAAAVLRKKQDILLEVNVSGETSKYGFDPDTVLAALRQIASLKNINVRGLMTIGPLGSSVQRTRSCFRKFRELRDEAVKVSEGKVPLGILSMGMTEDFSLAIEEGSNMIRIGRGIFGGG
ncbi:MAG: YggS family pyridoxal phosphate-dependent enzyme [Candidatus Omnitrophota bacterium]